jgi:methionyl-tRNA formyltransferase
MRIIFAGSPEIAVPSLKRLFTLYQNGKIELVGILTNADAPKGRKGNPEPTEIAIAADECSSELKEKNLALPVLFKQEKLDDTFRNAVLALKPDLLISFAYGKIFGPKTLGLFRLGGINIHPSLLPKYRGPSPITAAILNRDKETGITIQKLAKEMDAGNILFPEMLLEFTFRLYGTETTESLIEKISIDSADLLERVIESILADGIPDGKLQDAANASYCKLLSKDDGLISWDKSAAEIDAQIRAFYPWPLARTKHDDKVLSILEADLLVPNLDIQYSETDSSAKNGTVLCVDKAAGILVKTNDGILALTKLQYAGKKALDWRSFLNGARNFVGSVLE